MAVLCTGGGIGPLEAYQNVAHGLFAVGANHIQRLFQGIFLCAVSTGGITLFGHTHIPVTVYEEGVWLVNPGSVSAPRQGKPTYAVIDIEQNGIMPIIIGV